MHSTKLDHFSLEGEKALIVEGLWDAPKAALLAKLKGKNLVVITGGEREGRLLDDLPYFGIENAKEFPAWETLPGDEVAPSPDIIGRRFEILYQLTQAKEPQIIFCSLQAILQEVMPPDELIRICSQWKVGDELPFDLLVDELTELGYRRAPIAADKGEFAVRGDILDIFPLNSTDPYRIDFFGDTIEGIRIYDPISQKSTGKTKELFLCPATESVRDSTLLLDYLKGETVLVFDDLVELEDKYIYLKQLGTFDKLLKHECKHLYWIKEDVASISEVSRTKEGNLRFECMERTFEGKMWRHPFKEVGAANPHDALSIGGDIQFITHSDSEEKALRGLLPEEIPENVTFKRGYLSSGFLLDNQALIPYTEFTKRRHVRRQKWRSTSHTPSAEFHELSPGDIVVHFANGIGKYLGLEKRDNHLGIETEFLIIEYANGGKLYVPVSQSHLVSRYIGANESAPTFNVLGTKKWEVAKQKAQQAIIGYAHDLLKVSAERELKGGFVYPSDSEELLQFEEDFPFIETEDQLGAIRNLKEDMLSDQAMDRLICGDVGYGKTEVAMRAAFKAVVDGKKQVAILVPTTVLAMQHYDTFKERMGNYPINIGVVSRFRKPKEIKETIEKTKKGQIDILIGTHRLISKDVLFKDLGLLIVDEEQRFGVRAKEHLKKMKAGVDCLTLSATPIPRTLYLSLVGAREISLINTPPQDRLPIKTMISNREAPLIKNALLRELARDGQSYFIHNRVETIHDHANEIQKLVPEAKVGVVHGQMPPDAIDSVFHAFKLGQIDVLVATTIVESGIDIPNANTILIDRSDMYGLADLYQLRGRVGRWNRPAYAYFLLSSNREPPELVRKRLNALVEASGYGGGMKLAMRDLEIRGAGDILGTQQSGHISSVGFHLYCKLLKRTVEALRQEKPPTFTECKLEFGFDARLPETYIDASGVRLEIYHRIGESSTFDAVDEIEAELIDRFGPIPSASQWLLAMAKLRIFATEHHFSLLKFEKFTFTAKRGKGTKKCPLPQAKEPLLFVQQVSNLLS